VCTDGHAQSNFSYAFGNRYQHDIHDTYAAHDQRNRSNRNQQITESPHSSGICGKHIGRIFDAEIVSCILPQMCDLSNDLTSLLPSARGSDASQEIIASRLVPQIAPSTLLAVDSGMKMTSSDCGQPHPVLWLRNRS
jgi:hypothetical protein